MKKIIMLGLAVLMLGQSVKAESFQYGKDTEVYQQKLNQYGYYEIKETHSGNLHKSQNLILVGTLLFVGGVIAVKNANGTRAHGGMKAGQDEKYSPAGAVGMFAGTLCLAVGISLRF